MEVRAELGHAVLKLDENVTFENAAGFKVALERALGQGAPDFVVDFGAVNYLCSSAVGSLIFAVRKVREAGGRVFAVVSHAKLRHLFQLVHLNEMVSFVQDYEEAREHLDGVVPVFLVVPPDSPSRCSPSSLLFILPTLPPMFRV